MSYHISYNYKIAISATRAVCRELTPLSECVELSLATLPRDAFSRLCNTIQFLSIENYVEGAQVWRSRVHPRLSISSWT